MWLFAEQEAGNIVTTIFAGVFGSGGVIAIVYKVLEKRSNDRIREAELASAERIRQMELKLASEKADAERQQEGQRRIDAARAEALNAMHEQYTIAIELLKAQIAGLEENDKASRLENRERLVYQAEELTRLQKENAVLKTKGGGRGA